LKIFGILGSFLLSSGEDFFLGLSKFHFVKKEGAVDFLAGPFAYALDLTLVPKSVENVCITFVFVVEIRQI
jgi:hypothetical protein